MLSQAAVANRPIPLSLEFNGIRSYGIIAAFTALSIALLIAVFAVYAITGHVYSPLGASATPLTAVWNTITQAWPGVLIRLAAIPLAFWLIGKFKAGK